MSTQITQKVSTINLIPVKRLILWNKLIVAVGQHLKSNGK